MDGPVLSLLRLNPRHPAARADEHDVCRMHRRVCAMLDAIPQDPACRVLWAQPWPWILTVRAPAPVDPARLPTGWALSVTHQPWQPPDAGPARGVVVVNPCKQRSEPVGTGRRCVRTPLTGEQGLAWLRDRLAPAIPDIDARLVEQRDRTGIHPDGHRVRHTMLTVAVTGTVTDPGLLAPVVTAGLGRGRAHGGGLSIWGAL